MLINLLRIAAGAALMVGYVMGAQALPPPPPQLATGFVVHLPDRDILHLPSNAKGVLFQAALPNESDLVADIEGKGIVLAAAPPPLRANQFSILGPDGKRLSPVITRLEVDEVFGKTKPYYVARRGSACHAKTRHCTPGFVEEEQARWLKQGLRRGTLREATREVRRSVGLFRIAPQGGMRAGAYTFVYRHEGHDDIPLSLPDTARVHIDKVAVTLDGAPILLRPLGAPQPSFYFDGMMDGALWSQSLRYKPPARYGDYGELLTYATRTRRTDDPAACDYDCGREFGPYYWGRPETEVLSIACNRNGNPVRTYQISGFGGLLEVEDRLHAAPVLALSLGGKDMRCEGVALLREALATRKAADIRTMTCEVEGMPRENIADTKAMLALLGPLATNRDAQTRYCAWSGLVRVASAIRHPDENYVLEPATVRSVVAILAQAVHGGDAKDQQTAIRELVSLRHNVDMHNEDGRFDTVFSSAVPALAERAGDPKTVHYVRFDAIGLLGDYGKQAASAVPVLVRLTQDKDESLRSWAHRALERIRAAGR